MSGGRRWIGLVLALAAVGLIVWALLRGPEPLRKGGAGVAAVRPQQTPSARPTATPIPAVRVEGTIISTVDPKGREQWDLHADKVVMDGDAGIVALTTVHGAYFEAGELTVRFTAPRGTFVIASRDVTLEGGVQAQTPKGRSLVARTVKWIPKARRIEAAGDVVLRQEGMIVRSDRLEADTTLQHTKLSGNIHVTVVE